MFKVTTVSAGEPRLKRVIKFSGISVSKKKQKTSGTLNLHNSLPGSFWVNVASTCFCSNILVGPGTTFLTTNQNLVFGINVLDCRLQIRLDRRSMPSFCVLRPKILHTKLIQYVFSSMCSASCEHLEAFALQTDILVNQEVKAEVS